VNETTRRTGALKAFDCNLGFAQPQVDPTTQQPARCQVRIEDESLVNESGFIFDLANHESERKPPAIRIGTTGGLTMTERSRCFISASISVPTISSADFISMSLSI
jgi:hypothetical protein